MRTWLPYPNFAVSAHVLSARHLGQQLGDCTSMIFVMSGELPGGGMRFDQQIAAWTGYESSLLLWTDAVVREMHRRGYYEEVPSPLDDPDHWSVPKEWLDAQEDERPPWLGQEGHHARCRATLLAEDREWYAQMAWQEPARRDLLTPRPVPVPGETVMDEETLETALVLRRDSGSLLLRCSGTRERKTVPFAEFTSGRWRRCVTLD